MRSGPHSKMLTMACAPQVMPGTYLACRVSKTSVRKRGPARKLSDMQGATEQSESDLVGGLLWNP